MKFKNKVVLITGASSGIGRSFAERVAEDKAKLILVGRSIEKLKEVKNIVETKGSECEVLSIDLTNFKLIKDLFDGLVKRYSKIDAVFNNAGLGFIDYIWNMKEEDIHKIIDVNITSMILVSKYASEVMVQQRYGHIIMTSSMAGLVTLPQWSVYVASKWAITGFADCIRYELLPHNVFVTTLHPGAVKTEFFNKDKANIDIKSLGSAIESDLVADQVYRAFFTKKQKIFVPFNVKIFYKIKRFFPSFYDFLVSNLTKNIKYRKS